MRVVIIGAGITGLSAARELSEKNEVIIFEEKPETGGLSKTLTTELNEGVFRYDITGHFLHFKNEKTKKKVLGLFNDEEILTIPRKSYIHTSEVFVPYPFQSHIRYLPVDIRKECLIGFLNNLKDRKKNDVSSFFGWMMSQYGEGIVNHFMLPYNKKMWTVHPLEMTVEWMGRFVPKPSPEEIILGAVAGGKEREGYNAVFYYPCKGIGELIKKLENGIETIKTGARVERVDWKNKTVTVNSEKVKYDYLINTSPLKEFSMNILEPFDPDISENAEKLQHTSLLHAQLYWKGSSGPLLPSGTHWVYFPEDKFTCYRIGFTSNISTDLSPAGYSSVYVEVSKKGGFPFLEEEITDLIEKITLQLSAAGIIPEDKTIAQNALITQLSEAYVIYDRNWKESRSRILSVLEKRDIFSGGRYGAWEYSSMDDAVEWGEKLAEKCLSG